MVAPVQAIVAAFNSPDTAGQVMEDLKQGRREGLIGIIDAAVVVKDAEGKVKVTDAKKRGVKGFVTGGVIGALIGLVAAPAAAVTAAAAAGAGAASGGVLGGLTGKLRSAPLKAELKDLGANMPPGSSAIVALIEHDWVPQLQAELAAEGAWLIHDSIQADIVNQLNAGGNVLYTSGGGNLGSGTVRMADQDSESQVSGILVGENGVLVDNTVITNEPLEETAVR
jgi:uncharacterized membrane protein